jgi:Ca2+-binding RTX toxin-like protein
MAKIVGTANSETLNGTSGADEINGLGGHDFIYAGDGDDTIWSTDATADDIDGGPGYDLVVIVRQGLIGSLTLDMSGPVWYHSELSDGTQLNYVERVDITATIYNDDLTGGPLNDVLRGQNGDDYLNGWNGDDVLYGGNQADILDGGPGNDTLLGEDGDDVLFSLQGVDVINGGNGNDFAIIDRSSFTGPLSISIANPSITDAMGDGSWITHVEQMSFGGGFGNDNITGGSSWDELSGYHGNDHIWGGGGNDGVNGNNGADFLFGEDGNDEITGGTDDDELWGGNNNDVLYGDYGYDQLFGGNGADVLTGGNGPDHLVGGPNADRFVYIWTSDSSPNPGLDDIADFSSAEGDRIDLSAMDANAIAAGNQAFTFIGSGAFTGVPGQLHYTSSHYVEGDVDGNGTADFRIETNVASMAASDFIL